MPATIIMGGQWGDEGKGKLTDALAAQAQVVVRANGGSNAGHTIVTDAGVFKLRLTPSGILYPGCLCVIGAGVVIELGILIRELDELTERGIDLGGLRISDRAHVVMPYHQQLDRLEEARREGDELGTTLSGNGPAYADKAARQGIRIADLLDDATLRRRLAQELDAKNQILAGVYGEPDLSFNEVYQQLRADADRIRPYVVASEVMVQEALATGAEVLIECAQGAMLDIDYGSYPYVTSSSPTAAGACQGAGVAPTQVRRVVAVYKAYSTRVGSGPLPTELHDDTGRLIRERAHEFGTATGRPRRTGWFDAVAARHVARLNGVTEVALTRLDILDGFAEIQVGTGYELNGDVITHLPARTDQLAAVTPVLTSLTGWQEPIADLRHWSMLPDAARSYVEFLQEWLGAPITLIGVGPGREALVTVGDTPVAA